MIIFSLSKSDSFDSAMDLDRLDRSSCPFNESTSTRSWELGGGEEREGREEGKREREGRSMNTE